MQIVQDSGDGHTVTTEALVQLFAGSSLEPSDIIKYLEKDPVPYPEFNEFAPMPMCIRPTAAGASLPQRYSAQPSHPF